MTPPSFARGSTSRRLLAATLAAVAAVATYSFAHAPALALGNAVVWGVVVAVPLTDGPLWASDGSVPNRWTVIPAVLGSVVAQAAVSFAAGLGVDGAVVAALVAFVVGVLVAGAVVGAEVARLAAADESTA
ncbi:hypothetical protein [Halobaculum marinum]|uniref:SPW repeat-containing protein n=1 Tax=Halobaculum marinum TaxID=3031996 RepID=A0ABD5WUQ2_9EURY|nr:hypothetical protein [Halobaculum sp. DT55]